MRCLYLLQQIPATTTLHDANVTRAKRVGHPPSQPHSEPTSSTTTRAWLVSQSHLSDIWYCGYRIHNHFCICHTHNFQDDIDEDIVMLLSATPNNTPTKRPNITNDQVPESTTYATAPTEVQEQVRSYTMHMDNPYHRTCLPSYQPACLHNYLSTCLNV